METLELYRAHLGRTCTSLVVRNGEMEAAMWGFRSRASKMEAGDVWGYIA